MDTTDPAVIKQLNHATEDRFELAVEIERENRRFAAAKAELEAEHTLKLQALTEWQTELDEKIWSIINAHRPRLIAPGKKSFITMVAAFQLRRIAGRTTTLDKNSIMEVARKLGVVRHIADPPKGGWRFNQEKFLTWLAQNSEMNAHFDPFLEDVEDSESLTIKPNTNFTVQHESERISPPSTTIKKSL